MPDEITGADAPTSNSVETAPSSESNAAPVDVHAAMQSAIETASPDFTMPAAASDATPVETASQAPESPETAASEIPEDADLWTYLQSLNPTEEQAAPSTIAKLEAALAKDPDALAEFQSLAQEQSQIGETWQSLTKKVESFGGAEAIPAAVDVYANIMRGAQADENGVPGYQAAAMALYQANPMSFLQTTGGFLNLAMATPETRQSIVDFVLKSEGLNPEHVKDYKNVTLDGGYRPVVDTTAKLAVLEGVNKLRTEREQHFDYNKAFQRLPEKVQFQILENPDDAEYAKYMLDKEARDILNDEREQQTAQQREEQLAQQLEYDSAKESNTMLQGAVTDHLQTLLAQGVSEPVAKAAVFDALMEMWGGYFQPDSIYAKTERSIIDAYKNGDKSILTNGKKQYFEIFQGPLKSRLSKLTVKSAGILPKAPKPLGGAPPTGQFQGDAVPGNPNSNVPVWERMQAVVQGQ